MKRTDLRGHKGTRGIRSLRAAGLALAIPVLLVTVIGAAGNVWWLFDLASHFRFHYAIALAVAAALLAFGRWWMPTAISVLGLAVNAAMVLPLYLASPAPAAPESDTLQVVVFNVTAFNDRKDEVIELFRTSDADLIFIFEAGPHWESPIEAADLPYRLSPGLRTAFSFGNAVLVRNDLDVELRGIRVGPNTPRGRELDVAMGDVPIRILAVHPPSPTSREKAETRDEQLAGVVSWAASQDRPYAVVGDLNASPWSSGYRPIADSDLINSLYGFGLQGTWPARLGPLAVPIDHVLHSPALTTVARRVGPSLGSEHRPVYVTLAMADG